MSAMNRLGDPSQLSDAEYNAVHGVSMYFIPPPRNAKQVVDFCGTVDIDGETLARFANFYNVYGLKVPDEQNPKAEPQRRKIPIQYVDIVIRCHMARYQSDILRRRSESEADLILHKSPSPLQSGTELLSIWGVTEMYPMSDQDRWRFFTGAPRGEDGTISALVDLESEVKKAFTRLESEMSEIRAATHEAAEYAAAAHEMAAHGVDQAVTIAEIQADAKVKAGRRWLF